MSSNIFPDIYCEWKIASDHIEHFCIYALLFIYKKRRKVLPLIIFYLMYVYNNILPLTFNIYYINYKHFIFNVDRIYTYGCA